MELAMVIILLCAKIIDMARFIYFQQKQFNFY